MSELTKAAMERMVRALWKTQATPTREGRKPLPSELAAKKLSDEWLRKSGFDLKTLGKLQKQHAAEWVKAAPKAAAAEAKRWSAHVGQMQASAKAWAANVMTSSAAAPTGDAFFVAKPVSILVSDPKITKETHIESGNSFAKVVVDRKDDSTDTISFLFAFRNPGATAALFDFDTLLNVGAHLKMKVGAGLLNAGRIFLDAKLDVLTASQISDVQNVAGLGVLGDPPPFFGGESDETTVSLTRFLTVPGIVVESDEIAVLVVSLVVRTDLEDAHAIADLNSGNFRVLCPVVFVSRRPLPMKASGVLAAGETS
ncbi:MAG: hypothetical protein U0163_07700 [Gemmatimonadaceae bacterium]